MKKALLLLVVLAVLCSAEEIDFKKIGTSTIEYQKNWTVTTDKPGTTELTLTANLLSNNSDQKILSLEVNRPYTLTRTSDGDLKIVMKVSNPKQVEVLSVKALVQVSYNDRRIITAPPFPYPSGLDMPADTNLTAPSPEIIAKAAEVTAGSADGLEAIARLEEFVHDYMTYDLAYGSDARFSAQEAMASKRGVCDEYSRLFISMAKSVGIPARFVTGYLYSGKSSEGHGWVEAFVPGYGWIPVEPTNNEILNLDGTHVRASSGNDGAEIASQVVSVRKDKANVIIEDEHSLTLVSRENFPPFVNITMNTSHEGQEENLILSVENVRDSAVFVPLRLLMPPNVGLQARNETMVYIKPRSTVQKSYVLVRPDQNLSYMFVVVETPGGNFGDLLQIGNMPESNILEDGNGQEPEGNPSEQPPETATQCPLGFGLIGIAMLFAFAKN